MKENLGAKILVYPTPVYIVSTYGEDGTPNAMNVAWGGVCSSEPPCMMIALRKGRYTYDNIKRTGEFVVNIPDAAHVKEADAFGLVSGSKMNKFEKIGLTAKKCEFVDAPYIEEFPLAVECKVREDVEMGQHRILVGEIVNVIADKVCLNEKGMPDMDKVQPLIFDPVGNKYDKIGEAVANAFSVGLPLIKEGEK